MGTVTLKKKDKGHQRKCKEGFFFLCVWQGFPGGMVVKNPPANAGDTRDSGLIPGMGQFRGGGNGNPLQYSCLGNPMDRGDWWAIVHGVAESGTAEHTHTHTHTRAHTHTLVSGPIQSQS